ncbi:hypothetical protein BpHYR1_000026 [Brachionus plicatilis]|uniref:Uncharacterized protein n=1 Tax=Brachionus plicatilis TaxID=10195 RepID=A0A3M7QJP7_BRAPC|nr:hypothetical protein BpHYR1_000026 [Brachionus plicatilis]
MPNSVFISTRSPSNNGNLLRGNRQYGQVDAIELVKAAPCARLGKALVDAAQAPEVHLVRAVEHDHILTETSAHVLGGLGLAGAGGSGGRAAHRHVDGLGQRDVASVSQRCDHQSFCAAKKFILVNEVDVGDGDHHFVCVLHIVESCLFEPLEVGRRLYVHATQVVEYVALVNMNGDQSLVFGAFHFAQVAGRLVNERVEKLQKSLIGLVHCFFVVARVF